MFLKKVGKIVQNIMKGKRSSLSILERGLYTQPSNYDNISHNHSIMELRVYNTTAQKSKSLWGKIKELKKEKIQEDF